MDDLNNHWLVNIRNETLTSFFKIFPYFASDYFYIIVVAVGYWIVPRKRLFIDLGVLVPFTTLINVILKNSFAIARPPLALHLVPYHIDYGFPSGDVQVGVVFWGMIFFNARSILLKVSSCLIITGISLSRIYLGVHSIADVFGGLMFGSAILLIYNSSYCKKLQDSWFENSTKSYWYLLLLTSLIYVSTILNNPNLGFTFALSSIGVLIGFGISLKYTKIYGSNKGASVFQVFCSLLALLIFYKFFPLYKSNEFLFCFSMVVKYAILTLMIYIFLPFIQRKTTINR